MSLLIPQHRESRFTAPSVWAPRPDLYGAFGTDAAEEEVCELLASLVRAIKPCFVLETGTHEGRSAVYIADALRRNKYGRMVSLEINADYARTARSRVEDVLRGYSYLWQVEEISSFDYIPPQPIDFLFSDSELGTRQQGLERMRPFLAPRAWVAVHDSLTHRSVMGDLTSVGWIERVDIPTPRGLTIGRITA